MTMFSLKNHMKWFPKFLKWKLWGRGSCGRVLLFCKMVLIHVYIMCQKIKIQWRKRAGESIEIRQSTYFLTETFRILKNYIFDFSKQSSTNHPPPPFDIWQLLRHSRDPSFKAFEKGAYMFLNWSHPLLSARLGFAKKNGQATKIFSIARRLGPSLPHATPLLQRKELGIQNFDQKCSWWFLSACPPTTKVSLQNPTG